MLGAQGLQCSGESPKTPVRVQNLESSQSSDPPSLGVTWDYRHGKGG